VVFVKMTLQNLDYERLRSLTDVQTGLQRVVASAIASQGGRGIMVDEIQVKLTPGSVLVDARISSLTGAQAVSLQSELVASEVRLRDQLTSSILEVTGIGQACTGTLSVIDLQAKAEAIIASPTDSSRAQAAAWLFGITAACCCPLLGLLVWQHRARDHSSKGSQPEAPSPGGMSNTDSYTPLVDPENNNRQGATEQHVQQQAEAGTEAETQSDQTEREESQQTSQQPSQQPGEQSKDTSVQGSETEEDSQSKDGKPESGPKAESGPLDKVEE
jgi:hypothetical protein